MNAIATNRRRLGVIVLNYRTPDLVADCLASLEDQLIPGIDEAVVVDNCSPDDSGDRIARAIAERGWSSWARLVRSPVNGGFAAGNNVGLHASDADVYLLLNSDTVVRPGAVATLLDELAARPGVALLGPRLEWPDAKPQVSTFRFRTPLTELIAASRSGWLGDLFLRHVVARELDTPADDLDWVSFACVAIRRDAVERVGDLDERYFMYFEDMDYCRRARRAGFGVGYAPNARVVHLRGGTSDVKEKTRQRKRRPAYFYAARAHYFRAWYGLPGFALANALWTLGWLLSLVRGKSRAVEREWRDLWCSPDSGRPTPLPTPAPDAGGVSHA